MLAGACTMAFAQTTVYHYTSAAYIDAETAVAPEDSSSVQALAQTKNSSLPQFSPFTNAMRLRSSITVDAPFPANLEEKIIGEGTDYPFTWSFDTGLGTLNNTNLELVTAGVSTDAEGNITLFFFETKSSETPSETNQPVYKLIWAYGLDGRLFPNGIEGFVSRCSDSVNGQCDADAFSVAVIPQGGVWSRTQPSTAPVPVPGLGGFALMAVGGLMVGLVARRSKKISKNLAPQ